jgi:PAS domain S-box-containing protein
MRILAGSPTLAAAAPELLDAIGTAIGWHVGGVWEVQEEADVLRGVAIWEASGVDAASFKELSASITFTEGVGLPGRAWARREPVWVRDVSIEPNFPRARAASDCGLHTAFALPFLGDEAPLGVIEFYTHGMNDRDDALLAEMAPIAEQIGQFVRGRQTAETIAHSEALKTAMLESTLDAVIAMDHRGRIIEFNHAAEGIFGYAAEEAIGRNLADLLIPQRMRDRHRRGLARYAETGEGPILGRRVELSALKSDGEEFPIELAVTPIAGQEPPKFTALVRDITQRKRAEEALQFLVRASAALDESLDLETTLETLARLTVPYMADGCMVDILEQDGSIRRAASASAEPADEAVLAELRQHEIKLDGPHPIAQVMRTAKTEIVHHVSESFFKQISETTEYYEALHNWPARSVAIVPLKVRGQMLGTLSLASFTTDRTYGEAELAVMEDLARRAANAVENARLFDQRSRIATTLQRSLLPPHLPNVPGAEVAARFQAGPAEGDVGGDFYDVFDTGRGDWLIAIGDVAGRGVEAAVTTALARHTIRAAAINETDPTDILRLLNEALRAQLEDLRFCTVALGLLKIEAREANLSLATAGHPLPLCLRAGGRVEPIGRPGVLLGVVPDPAMETTDIALTAGETVVFYTNGVAGSGASDELDMAELTSALTDCVDLDAAATVNCIDRAVVEARLADPRDDAAILVIRILGTETVAKPQLDLAMTGQ